MKLFKRVIIYFVFSSLLVFVLGSFTIYYVLKALITEEVDETLFSEKNRIVKQLQNSPIPIPDWATLTLEIKKMASDVAVKESLNDTLIHVKETGEFVPLRQLHFYTRLKNTNYRITLRRSLIEKDDLLTGVFGVMIAIFIAMIVLLNAVNIWSDRTLWKPFYDTLQILNHFKLNSKKPLNLPDVATIEFQQLNKTLNEMADKLQRDYRNLKEFSENAAHEMQTPLAILRSKLDVFIQDEKLTDEQLQDIRAMYDALNRLNRLNQSLNLLIKIENRQFEEKIIVDFRQVIEKQLENMEALIQSKRLTVITRFQDTLRLAFNPFMAETLVSNLLTNAIKHNVPQGRIEIEIREHSLTICNTGESPEVDTTVLFERFKKGRASYDSPGLGLTIVKQICQQNGVVISYTFKNGWHSLILRF